MEGGKKLPRKEMGYRVFPDVYRISRPNAVTYIPVLLGHYRQLPLIQLPDTKVMKRFIMIESGWMWIQDIAHKCGTTAKYFNYGLKYNKNYLLVLVWEGEDIDCKLHWYLKYRWIFKGTCNIIKKQGLCISVCLSVPMDLANRWTDQALLYSFPYVMGRF